MFDVVPSYFDLVDFGTILDVASTIRVLESRESFAQVVFGRRDTSHHHRLAVATERVL